MTPARDVLTLMIRPTVGVSPPLRKRGEHVHHIARMAAGESSARIRAEVSSFTFCFLSLDKTHWGANLLALLFLPIQCRDVLPAIEPAE